MLVGRDKFEKKRKNNWYIKEAESDDARKLSVNVKIDDTFITFINVYAQNTENARIGIFNRLRTCTSTHAIRGVKCFVRWFTL